MAFRRIAWVGAAGAALLLAGAASAQTPLDDPLDPRDAKRVERMEKVVRELRAIVFQLRDTGRPVVVQPADTDARLDEASRRIDDLEQTLRGLNGSLEAATRDLDAARREIAALKTETQTLTDRFTALEQKIAAPPAEMAAPPLAGDPVADFAKARQLMTGGDYDGAEATFTAYVEAYPDGARTPEARYWLGRTRSVRGAHTEAAQSFIGAIRGWPQTGWAPDAVVELSRALLALKKPADACQALGELARRYPKASPGITNRAAALRNQAKCGT